MELEYTLVSFENLNVPARYAEKVRGYFGNKYKEITYMHNHANDKFIYSYPLVQYKVIKSKPYLCGIKEGSKILAGIAFDEEAMTINGEEFDIFQKSISKSKQLFGVAEDYISYEFLTPWIALNQDNVKAYEGGNNIFKEEMLKKILIGNIISMSKGIGYTIQDAIHVWIDIAEIEVKFKNINMKAFKGRFKTNFYIPDYLGIGKSVSRGFGTIRAMKC